MSEFTDDYSFIFEMENNSNSKIDTLTLDLNSTYYLKDNKQSNTDKKLARFV